MTVIRKFLKNSSLFGITEILNKGFPFIVILFIIRILGIEINGQFAASFALAGLFTLFTDIGLSTFLVRDISRDKARAPHYLSHILSLKLLLSLLMLAVGSVFVYFTKNSSVFFIYFFGLFYTLLDAVNVTVFQAGLRAINRVPLEAISKLVRGLTLFAGGLIGVLVFKNIYAVLIGYIGSTVIQLVLNLVFLRKNGVNLQFAFKPKLWKQFLSASSLFFVSHIMFIIYSSIDTVMLSYMKGDAATGLYNSAYIFYSAAGAMAGILHISVFPLFSQLFMENKERMAAFHKKVAFITFFLSVLGAVILAVVAPYILKFIIIDADIVTAVQCLRLLVFGLIFSFQNTVLAALFNSSHQEKKVFLPVLGGAIINIVFNVIFIPSFGIIGASAVTVATEALVVLIMYGRYFLQVRPTFFKIAKP